MVWLLIKYEDVDLYFKEGRILFRLVLFSRDTRFPSE